MIPFNKPYQTGKELEYIQDAINRGHISGNGYYTKKCHEFFQDCYRFHKCLLTPIAEENTPYKPYNCYLIFQGKL